MVPLQLRRIHLLLLPLHLTGCVRRPDIDHLGDGTLGRVCGKGLEDQTQLKEDHHQDALLVALDAKRPYRGKDHQGILRQELLLHKPVPQPPERIKSNDQICN